MFDRYAEAAIATVRVAPGEQTLEGCPPGTWQWMQRDNGATVTEVRLEGTYPQTRLVIVFELAYLLDVTCEWSTALWSEDEKDADAQVPVYRDGTWISITEDIATSGPRGVRGRVRPGDRIRISHRRIEMIEQPSHLPLRATRRTPNLDNIPRTWPNAL